jgi:two-component system, cell cycle response regulator
MPRVVAAARHWAGKALRGVRGAFRSLADFIFSWSITTKVRLLLVFLIVLPAISGLIILETRPQDMQQYLVVMLVAGIILLAPLSWVISHYLVLRELGAVEEFCLRIKAGDYDAKFLLPPQADEEHEILLLKRNLNWMAHVISRREMQLENELARTHQDKSRFESMSMLDPLTGLFNRRTLEAKVVGAVHEASATCRPLTMLFLDADRFKSVNDTFGHQAGDDLLRNLGTILRTNVRENVDVPFRYGGDEFGVLLVGIGIEQAEVIAGRILRAYNAVRIGQTTLSIGIAGFCGPGVDHEGNAARLLAAADRAAYQAKQRGGNRVHVSKEKAVR